MTGPAPIACARFEQDLSALLDGELDAAREAEVRAHAEGCARCRARLAELARVDLLLAAAPVREASAALHEGLRARIAAEAASPEAREPRARSAPPLRPRRLPRRLFAAALAAAAALALYLALPRARTPLETEPEPRVARAPEHDPEFDALPAEEIALGLELDTAEDLDVIANLELLEALVALEEGRG